MFTCFVTPVVDIEYVVFLFLSARINVPLLRHYQRRRVIPEHNIKEIECVSRCRRETRHQHPPRWSETWKCDLLASDVHRTITTPGLYRFYELCSLSKHNTCSRPYVHLWLRCLCSALNGTGRGFVGMCYQHSDML